MLARLATPDLFRQRQGPERRQYTLCVLAERSIASCGGTTFRLCFKPTTKPRLTCLCSLVQDSYPQVSAGFWPHLRNGPKELTIATNGRGAFLYYRTAGCRRDNICAELKHLS